MGDVLRNVGPQDPDEAAGLVGNQGIRYGAKRLIQAVAASRPAELTGIQMREEDKQRTRFLDLDEVEDATREYVEGGKRPVNFTEVLSARVRGKGEEDTLMVEVLFGTESGRTSRCAIPYKDLHSSREQYGDALEEGQVAVGDPDDPKALAKALEEAQAEIRRLRKGGADRTAGDDDEEEPDEPFDGYSDVKATDLAKQVKDGDHDELLEELRDAENDSELNSQPRKSVLTAIEAREGVLNPYEGYADASVDDVAEYLEADDRTAEEIAAVRTAEEARPEPRKGVLEALDKAESSDE